MVEKIKENDTELEWTYGYSDKDLLELINSTIRKSKSLYDKCTLNNIPYFETSLDRYNAYNDVYKYIENELDL